jgi:chitin elicitor receptor kinase 1
MPFPGSASQAEGIKVDRSIQFSYEELCDATHNFSMEHKIGQGGFGSVYYAELRGEVRSTFSQCET